MGIKKNYASEGKQGVALPVRIIAVGKGHDAEGNSLITFRLDIGSDEEMLFVLPPGDVAMMREALDRIAAEEPGIFG